MADLDRGPILEWLTPAGIHLDRSDTPPAGQSFLFDTGTTVQLEQVIATDNPGRKIKAPWDVKRQQVATLLPNGSSEDVKLTTEDREHLI